MFLIFASVPAFAEVLTAVIVVVAASEITGFSAFTENVAAVDIVAFDVANISACCESGCAAVELLLAATVSDSFTMKNSLTLRTSLSQSSRQQYSPLPCLTEVKAPLLKHPTYMNRLGIRVL